MAVSFKTFEDRGVYVGFTANILIHARCRPSRTEEFEYDAMIPNWAGGGEATKGNDLVMNFTDLPIWTPLNSRDELLHELVQQRRQKQGAYLDPLLVRELRLKADIERGEEMFAQQAQHELDVANLDVQDSFIDILAMFGRKYGAISGQKELEFMTRSVLVTLASEDPRYLMKLVKVIITTITKHSPITRDELQERLDLLSSYSAPMCSLVTDEPFGDIGYLSRQNMRLQELHDSLTSFSTEQPRDIQRAIDVILMNIQSFLAFTKEKSSRIKLALLQDSFYLDTKRYNHLLEYILEQRSKISFALDGWSRHGENWAVTHDENLEGKYNVIFHILREMPTAPEELEDEVSKLFDLDSNVMALRSKMVRELHGWADDKMDMVLQQRLRESRQKEVAMDLVEEHHEVRDTVVEALK